MTMTPRIIGIIGSRDYTRLTDVDALIESFTYEGKVRAHVSIISGGARGVDRRAAVDAKKYGIPVEEKEPDPDLVARYGFRHAALRRNREIVERAEIVHAFWDGDSTGTSNAIAHAVVLGKALYVHTTTGVTFVAATPPVPAGRDAATKGED